jgi:acetolactate synthase-1/2/3 large subunit
MQAQTEKARSEVMPENEGEQLAGASIVWEVLTEEGVDVVFGYPGGAIMPTYDALPRYPHIHHVLTRHEQAAAHMADGYARASGKVGVAIATSGPGATNLVTGIATAMLDSSGIVCITGQVASHLLGTDAFQETDVNGVTLPITKYNYLVTSPDEIAPCLREAFALARSGRRGPIVVDITKDAQIQSTQYTRSGRYFESDRKRADDLGVRQWPSAPRDEQVAEFISMLDRARRPIIIAGQGIIAGGADKALQELVDRTGIPVANTLLGLGGFPASHSRALGMLGMHGHAWVNQAVQRADLLIALGMRFDDRVTGDPRTFATQSRKIHIELDETEINKIIEVDLPIHADLGKALPAINEALSREPKDRFTPWRYSEWHKEIDDAKRDAEAHTLPSDQCEAPTARYVLDSLWEVTEGNATLVTDVGQHQMWAAQCYHHDTPRSLITSGGLGTMGFALPASIGARLSKSKDEIWVVAGDGGFQMTSPELTTAKQEGIDLNIAVLNNGYLGMVRQWQEMFFGSRYVATPITSPDFVKLAEAHGHTGIRVTEKDQVKAAIETARKTPGVTLVEFCIQSEDAVYPMVPSGAPIDDMIRRPKNGDSADESKE